MRPFSAIATMIERDQREAERDAQPDLRRGHEFGDGRELGRAGDQAPA